MCNIHSIFSLLFQQIKSIITARRTTAIIVFIFSVSIFSTAPIYTVNKLGMRFSKLRNKTIFGLLFTADRDYVQKIAFIINNFSTPLAAFILIVTCTVILVIKLQNTTAWRKKSTSSSQADRISSRGQKVAKMTAMISTLFIVCFIPFCISTLVAAFEPEVSYGGKYIKVGILLVGFSLLLESINSSMNIFIYFHMSSNYRDVFRKVFY